MTFAAALRRIPATTPLALVCALTTCFSAPAAAAPEATLPAVVVSGARFASDPALLPIGATVITADDIRRAGVNDVNRAIRALGGVYGRQSLDASPDFGLDLRGFGANSNQNLVVVLDGVRLSENELGTVVLSAIPIDTVERIEIIRGGASVLYGEGATGGVIQIVTKRPTKASGRGNVLAEAGQFGARELRATLAHTWDGFALDATAGKQRTDNYRANNQFDQTNFSGGAQWAYAGGRAGVRIDSARQDARFPGSLTLAQFNANPRQAATPKDFGSVDLDRVTAFVEHRFGAWEVAADLSYREKTVKATYISSFGDYNLEYDGDQTQFSPRVRHLAQFDGMLNELVAGIDLLRWNRNQHTTYGDSDASQKSRGFYVRDEIKWDAAHEGRLAIGARHEKFDKEATSPKAFSQSQNAWEVQGSYNPLKLLTVYGKAGQSYRVANADENSYTPTFDVALKGQTSHDLEAGLTWGAAALQLTGRLFRHALTNEIFYDPTIGYGANTNLDPTRRQGAELDLSARVAQDWRVSAHLQHVDAKFTEGKYAGREMVLVPKNVLSARLAWVPADGQSVDLGVQWTDSQRYGADFTNSCGARIPSATTFDGRYGVKLGPWELAVSGLNLTDKHYFSNAFGCKSGIYPSDGRQLKMSARYDF